MLNSTFVGAIPTGFCGDTHEWYDIVHNSRAVKAFLVRAHANEGARVCPALLKAICRSTATHWGEGLHTINHRHQHNRRRHHHRRHNNRHHR
jgi:hypothetical protein